MKPANRFAATFLAASFFVTAVEAADWPGFRGPMSTGVSTETDLPVKWTKDNMLWKVKLPGPGAASPNTFGDKVFIVCYTGYGTGLVKGSGNPFGKDPIGKGMDPFGKGKGFGDPEQKKLRRVVMCLDAAKGDVLWQKEIEPRLPEQVFGDMVKEHGYATNTPVTDGERLYVFFGKVGVFAFDFTGKKLWQTDVGNGTYLYGSAASLALHKNLVIVNAAVEGKSLMALDKVTGKVAWRNKDITATWASPILVETKDGKHELVLSQPEKIVGYDPDNGKELWRCQGLKPPSMGSIYSTPVAKDGVIYVAGGVGPGGQAQTIAVRAGGRGDVNKSHVLWRAKTGTTVNSPLVCGDHVYCIDGSATCLRLDNGKVVYKNRLNDSSGEYPSAVAAGDKIYQITRFDGMYVMAAGGKFQLLARNQFQGDNSIFNGSPAISNGRIFVRSNAYLYCIGKNAAS